MNRFFFAQTKGLLRYLEFHNGIESVHKGSSYTGAVDNLCFQNNASTSVLKIAQSGNVGIGKINSGYTLDVSGNISCFEVCRNGTLLASTFGNNLLKAGDTMAGILYTNNTLVVGNNNSYPNIKLGSTNGNNIAISDLVFFQQK